jgi:hypothetical protein
MLEIPLPAAAHDQMMKFPAEEKTADEWPAGL